jgi:hypothetical protein
MHIRSWLFVTACTLLLTGFTLSRAGWLGDKSAPSGRRAARAHATTQDLFASESGCRFRSCEPRHWKYLMLKH